MKELQLILLALNAAIAAKGIDNTKIGVGADSGKFHINKIAFDKKGISSVTNLHTSASMDDAIVYFNTNNVIDLI